MKHGTHAATVRRRLAALYQGSPLARVYTALKFSIIPFEQFSSLLPAEGRILEVGCGYGYIANYLALESGARLVVGNDPAEDRVAVARRTIGDRGNIRFLAADSRQMPDEAFDGAVIADVLHHVPYAEQRNILDDLYRKLKPGGTLVIRETDIKPGLRFWLFNWLLEWVLYLGVEKLKFRKAAEWRQMLESIGYEVRRIIPNPPLFPYITATFICAKPSGPAP